MILKNKKIALAHDWLTGISGADRVLKCLHGLYPQAPIYTLFQNKNYTQQLLPDADIRTSNLQSWYDRFNSPRPLAPFIPSAVESFDVSDFDVVISSSAGYMTGLVTNAQTLHISYCYSPTRVLWDWTHESKQYVRGVKKVINSLFQHVMRVWDRAASARVDRYIAISSIVRDRIDKYYRLRSDIVYPPTPLPLTEGRTLGNPENEPYFLIVSRLHRHKNIDVAINACQKLGWRLVIIGTGPDEERLRNISGSQIRFMGHLGDDELARYYSHAEAFLMPQVEDFGLTAIESMQYGTPVIALKAGGALDYIQQGINGLFFEDAVPEALAYAMLQFSQRKKMFDSKIIKESTDRFSEIAFKRNIQTTIESYIHA